jgi:hypothetical protein
LEVDNQRDELLLHTVVQLPFEGTAFRIGGGDQARCAQPFEGLFLRRHRKQLSVMAGRASRVQAP